MVNRGDLRHTSEYKSWVKDQKSYDAVSIPFIIFGLAVVCFFYIWLYENCDFVSSFDGLAWEQSTLKVLRERIYSNEFYDKVLLDYKSNPADYK